MNVASGFRAARGQPAAALAVALALGGCGSAPLDAISIDPASLARDLVAHWTFDDGTGTTVADVSGNGHDGVLNGGTWVAAGRFGGALELAAGNSVSVANFPQATPNWTVSVWTRSSASGLAASTSDLSTIISTETVFAGGWQIHLDNRPNYHRFDAAYWAGATVNDYVVVFCACIAADRWIHLTTVWDAGRARMTLYRDDLLVDELPMPSPILIGDTTLYMGAWSQFGRFLVGDIDDFAIWHRALEPAEIAALSQHSPGP